MERIKIVTDCSTDLPEGVAEALDITVLPLIVNFGERSYEDMSLSTDEFWRLADGPAHHQTSQPPLGAFQTAFKSWVDRGCVVLCTTITGRHSGTFNTAWSAAQAFGDRVTVFDSLSLSIGHGWQFMGAARAALQGATMDRILDLVRSIRERTHIVIQSA